MIKDKRKMPFSLCSPLWLSGDSFYGWSVWGNGLLDIKKVCGAILLLSFG